MPSCQCQGIERFFDDKEAESELKSYRRKGPARTTRMLLDALGGQNVVDKTLLDIGGGVGAIQHELLRAGATRAESVDASSAYIRASKQGAERQGHVDRISYRSGDFVDLATGIESADIVTLDRVICCYHDAEALLDRAASKAGSSVGLVYPRDNWLSRRVFHLFNLFFWLKRCPFRVFVHSSSLVQDVLTRNGLQRVNYKKTMVWQVVLYARSTQ